MRAVLLLLLVLLGPSLAACLDRPDGEEGPGAPTPDGPTAEDLLGALVWRAHQDAPTAKTEVTAAAVGEDIYVIGGITASMTASRTVERYDAAFDRWTPAADYPIAIHHTTAVAVEDHVYVLGGYHTTAVPFVATNLAHRLDTRTGTWEAVALLPTPRGAHAAALVDGIIYLVGGIGQGGELVAAVHAYNPQTNTWSTGHAPLPTPREHVAAAGHNGTLYVAGGRTGGFATNMAVLEAYDPTANQWTRLADMPTARGGLAAAAFKERIVVVGGEGTQGTFPHVEAYDPATDTWMALADLPQPRHGLGAAVAKARLYIMLGGPDPGFTFSGTVQSLGA